MKALTLSILMGASVTLAPASQASGPVMKGEEVTEIALINALTPGAPVRTRSFGRDTGTAPAPSASASLLITFATSSAELSDEGKRILDTVGRALNSNKLASFKFEIEGHADPRGTDEFNHWLSEARAASAREYLVQNHQIAGERLKAYGKGETELLNTQNATAPENRRVTIKTVIE